MPGPIPTRIMHPGPLRIGERVGGQNPIGKD
jgi:hypothetical protein